MLDGIFMMSWSGAGWVELVLLWEGHGSLMPSSLPSVHFSSCHRSLLQAPCSPLVWSGLVWSALLCSCLPMFTEELGCTVSSAFPISFPQLNAHQVMKAAVSGHSLNQLDCLSPASLAASYALTSFLQSPTQSISLITC